MYLLSAAETRPLRHAVLRPHQPITACVYPGDEAPTTGHFGVYEGQTLIGVASVFEEAPPHDPRAPGWRIRGMAVRPTHQGKGVGGALLEACLQHARAAGGSCVWCNARQTAARFYSHHGFERQGEPFDLPGIGPHFVMVRRLGVEG